jgi:exopolyphosphatase/guanosine-5'-triphosphate,3'-diphosphate pyrophosphatase
MPAPYPRKAGAIDVGSNAIRVQMVAVSAQGCVRKLVARRYALRLGGEVFRGGSVGGRAIERLVNIFRVAAKQRQRHEISAFRAVATAALRAAENRVEVVEQLYAASGLRLEVISGAEESRLSAAAIRRACGWIEPDAVLVDLGGGTLELQQANRIRSLPLGTLRLLDALPEDLDAAIRWIAEQLPSLSASTLVATGGNFTTLAEQLPAPGVLPRIDLVRLDAWTRRIARWSLRDRMVRLDVRADRADTILPACMVLAALRVRTGAREVLVPGSGLREGILQQLTAEALGRLAGQAALARTLFTVLAPFHGLWDAGVPSVIAPWQDNVHPQVARAAARAWPKLLRELTEELWRRGARRVYRVTHRRRMEIDAGLGRVWTGHGLPAPVAFL